MLCFRARDDALIEVIWAGVALIRCSIMKDCYSRYTHSIFCGTSIQLLISDDAAGGVLFIEDGTEDACFLLWQVLKRPG